MDRGLLQREVAREIGVTTSTLFNWESGVVSDPEVRHLPAILSFLGYDPREKPEDLAGLCRWRREALGLSQRALARRLGLDPTSVMRVETEKPIGPKVRRRVERFVKSGPGEPAPSEETGGSPAARPRSMPVSPRMP